MPIVIKKQPVPIYETTCCECGSVFRYKAVEVSWMTYITCPVCGVSNWASLTPINDDTDEKRREDVDAEFVRHGHWIEGKSCDYIGYPIYECSECGCSVGEDASNYCPNCGAKMDGVGENEID